MGRLGSLKYSGQIAQLATAPLFAASYLMTKSMTGKLDSQTIVALLTLFCTIFLLPMALIDWVTPTLHELVWLFVTALLATFGHYAMTRALAAAPISALIRVIDLPNSTSFDRQYKNAKSSNIKEPKPSDPIFDTI